MHLTVAHDLGSGPHNVQAGIRVNNIFGNFSNSVTGQNSRYSNNGIGGFSRASGARSFPYENEPIGDARTYVFYLTAKY